MNKLIILTGPTAVGKTNLSISLAKAVNGEIVSADSMQVYRGMDIGSAKISDSEKQGVPHHLIDILDPTEEFNVVSFKEYCEKAFQDIYQRGHVPVLVGGTGFYIQAVLKDIDFTETERDEAFRKELEHVANTEGPMKVYEMLKEVDPESAIAIPPGNVKRCIRALEYYKLTGEKISVHNERERMRPNAYDAFYFVLNDDREKLYSRIGMRVDAMMEQGLVEEVERLREQGCVRGMTSMQGIGYKEILDYLDGFCSLDEAVERIKLETRHFAKRQLTWFRREKNVIWMNRPDFPGGGSDAELLDFILKRMQEKKDSGADITK